MEKTFIFSICTRVVNYEHIEFPIKCVESIREFYPKADIVIVDSDSPNKNHFSPLKNLNCVISDHINLNYEAGAIWDTYEKYDRDRYIFLQDSMYLVCNIDEYIEKELTHFGGIYKNFDHCTQQNIDWINENIKKSDYVIPSDGFNILTFNSMIISKELMDKFKMKNLHKILPTNKIGSEGMERIFGIALKNEGIDIESNTSTKLFGKVCLRRN